MTTEFIKLYLIVFLAQRRPLNHIRVDHGCVHANNHPREGTAFLYKSLLVGVESYTGLLRPHFYV